MERIQRLSVHLCSAASPAARAGGDDDEVARRHRELEQEKDTVLYEVLEGGVALITLNRPSRGNALTNNMQIEYFNALDRADKDPSATVIVVTGSGSMFCVGADMDMLKMIGNGPTGLQAPENARNVDQIQAFKISKPIIGAINGPAAGLGMVLALCTDIRFTTKRAKWTTAFAKRGLVAEHGSSWILPRIVGASNAMDLLLSSRVVAGAEAKEIGLVSKVFETPQELMEETLRYAREMARMCSPASMAAMKAQVYDHYSTDARQAFDESMLLMKNSFKHPDSVEGVKSYVEKRDPSFQGLGFGRIQDLK